jgi:hypothetical protein
MAYCPKYPKIAACIFGDLFYCCCVADKVNSMPPGPTPEQKMLGKPIIAIDNLVITCSDSKCGAKHKLHQVNSTTFDIEHL